MKARLKNTTLAISMVNLVFVLSFCASAQATSGTLRYGGELLDGSGAPISDGSYTLTFALYDQEMGGEAYWSESLAVDVVDGRFTTGLGAEDGPGLKLALAANAVYLGITVEDGLEMAPRFLVPAVPFSIQAANAEELGGIPAEQFLTLSGERICGSGELLQGFDCMAGLCTIRCTAAGETALAPAGGKNGTAGTAARSDHEHEGYALAAHGHSGLATVEHDHDEDYARVAHGHDEFVRADSGAFSAGVQVKGDVEVMNDGDLILSAGGTILSSTPRTGQIVVSHRTCIKADETDPDMVQRGVVTATVREGVNGNRRVKMYCPVQAPLHAKLTGMTCYTHWSDVSSDWGIDLELKTQSAGFYTAATSTARRISRYDAKNCSSGGDCSDHKDFGGGYILNKEAGRAIILKVDISSSRTTPSQVVGFYNCAIDYEVSRLTP